MSPKRRDDSHVQTDLPNAEMEVLALVRREGGATTRQVAEGLAPQRKMGTSAAQALLLRLEAKGLLHRQRIEGTKIYRYLPTEKAAPAHRGLARRFMDRVFSGSPVQLMASIFDTRPPTDDEIRQLKELIEQARKRNRKG
jgi:BlaI family transcriptional regulator, penicillinase repressor